jgi:hypothetical protein
MALLVRVEAVFQVVTLQGHTFVRQLFPLVSSDAELPAVIAPEQALLHFVFTISVVQDETGGDVNGEDLMFTETWTNGNSSGEGGSLE